MKPSVTNRMISAALAAIALPSLLWSASTPCDLDWSAVQGLRVDVEDSVNCDGGNDSVQNPSVSAALKGGVDCGEYILAITVQGSVEDQDAGFDYVYVNGINYFSSRGNNGECNMHSTSETRQITVKAKDSITLSYDTVDSNYHKGGYAQITNIALVKAPAGCGGGGSGGCSGGSCSSAPGGGQVGNSSVDIRISLGDAIRGLYPGMFHIKSALPDATVYAPDAINFGFDIDLDSEVIRSGTTLRQVLTEQILADIVTISAHKYEVRFYHAADAGTKVSGVYVPTGSAYRTWTVEDPDSGAGSYHRVRVTDDSGGTPVVHDYTWVPANQNWTLVSANLKEIGRKSETVGAQRIETYWLKDVGGDEVHRQVTTYETFAWGEEKVAEVIDPDNLSGGRVTSWTYFDDAINDGVNYGHLKLMTEPDGYWERYEYDAEGRAIKVVSPVGDALPGALESVCRVITRSYSFGWPQETEVETVLGQEVGRRYTINDGMLTREIVAASPGADYYDPANLVTETVRIDYGEFEGETYSIKRSDGTMTFYSYSRSGVTGEKTTVTEAGVPDAWESGIVDGTRTTLVEDAFGHFLSEDIVDIAGNRLLGTRLTTASDAFGRPTRIDYLDGTAEEFSFACCGLQSQTDREGVVTFYTYDGLKRRKTETRAGVTMDYAYDAADRIVQVTRIGSDSSPIVMSKTAYDLSGRRIWTEDALARRTSYSYGVAIGGGEAHTTTHDGDGSTEVETHHRDGRVYTVAGTAASPRKWLYGVAAGGLRWTQEIALGEGGAETEWVKTWENMLGQTVRREYPDGAEETYVYDAQGRQVRQTDPDGVQTLFAYNARGERTVTALDLNRNGVIDYDGTDRITRTVTDVIDQSGTTVHRTTTEVWEVDGIDTPVSVNVFRVSADGLETWQAAYGLTTHTIRAYDGLGGRTETTTSPDGSSVVRAHVDGRLASELRKDADDVVLSEVTYAYDAHGRLLSQTVTDIGATTYVYFADDQVASITTPDPDPLRSGLGYDPQTIAYAYNARGWLSKITHTDGAETHNTYYPTGQAKRTWGARVYPMEYAYDPQGRIKTLTTWQDFAGTSGAAVTTWNYDSQRGWLLNKAYPDSSSGLPAPGSGPAYTYTDAGRLETRAWARGVVTTYAYNDAGDLASVTYSDSTPSVANTYDRLGRLHTIADAAGVLTRDYASGRLTGEAYTGTGLLSGESITRTLDSLHRLSGLSATSVPSVAYGYDDASRLATVAQGGFTATYAYADPLGAVASMVVRNGATERATQLRTVDRLGRIGRVDTLGGGALLHARRDYTYDNANQRTLVEHEDTRRWAYGYDALGQVISAEKRLAGGAPLPGYAFGYDFDDIGNRVSTTTNGWTAGYTADLLNRYTQREVPGAVDVRGTASSSATVLVNDGLTARAGADFYRAVPVDNTADPVLAEIKVQVVDLGPPTQVATETREAFVTATPESFAYDDDGNLIADGRWSYTWDGENRLVAMETTVAVAAEIPGLKRRLEFVYDGGGRRIGKIVKMWNPSLSQWEVQEERRFLYDDWNLLKEETWNSSTSTYDLIASYAWGLDLSGSLQGAGGVGGLLWVATEALAPGYDGNGNIVVWIDLTTGDVAGRRDYGPFGETVLATGVAKAISFAFSTKYTDEESQFLYYGYRYYNTSFGRWVNRDPIGERGGRNLYGMIGNDGINQWDYLGLSGVGTSCCDECPTIGLRQNVKVVRVALARGDMENDPIDLEAGQALLDSINMVSNISTVGGVASGVAQGAIRGAAGAASDGLLSAAQSEIPSPGSGLASAAINKGANIQFKQAMNLSARIYVYVEWEECKEKKCARGPASRTYQGWVKNNKGTYQRTFGDPPKAGREITASEWAQATREAIAKFSVGGGL